MFIFITLDNNHREIWERSGRATFSSFHESSTIVEKINERTASNPYAIGIYRAFQSRFQKFPPSLLRIKKAVFIPSSPNRDIFIYFDLIKKLPPEFDGILYKNCPKSTPLIQEIYSDAEILSMAGISLSA